MEHTFLRPRLTGRRFDSHTLPVELLSDFAALQELIIELAKQKYREANPDRKRIPRGFSDGISLNLATIEKGSTYPCFVLASALAANTLFAGEEPVSTYFEQAKEAFVVAVAQAEKNEAVGLDARFTAYFNRIGKNLLDDEAIEFNPTAATHKSILNRETRRRILLARNQHAEYTETTTLIVRVTELDKAKQSFSIQNHRVNIEGIELASEHQSVIYDAFHKFDEECYVKMKALALYSAAHSMNKIISMERVEVLEAGDMEVRLEHIAALKAGWYYGEGEAFDAQFLQHFLERFNSRFSDQISNPSVYPSIEGNLQLEWTNETADISLVVHPESLQASYHLLVFEGEQEESMEFNLNLDEDWDQLNKLIAQFFA